ncbi:universal stress protein [Mycobacterium sp. 141]|uniref:universal stress protein n=1 Tax=Mycobacterium sp. 141 TaxID=1120797 RepID=UPI0003A41D4F|nr:universal stress protein [Mycobacterium sp. 141]
MNDSRMAKPVVVGIDGSAQSIAAAQWGIKEAISRDVPLRLVYVMKSKHPSNDDYYRDIHHAEESLRFAQAAVDAAGTYVKVETAILDGPPGAVLIEESRDAALICVGSVGIGQYARSILGSTAAELTEKAHCPVAVIRPEVFPSQQDVDWVVVAVNDKPDNDLVVESALTEAELRRAPVLMLGSHGSLEQRVKQCSQHHPGVHIYPITEGAGVARFLKRHDERVQLAVIGSTEANQLAHIIGPHGHRLFNHARSSTLIVR